VANKLLFVDTNIWLDFYRARTEAGLALLRHLEQVASKIIVTYQLEMEFKKNRHAAILEGMQDFKAPPPISRPGLFSDARATKAIRTAQESAESRVKRLKARYIKALENPTAYDPVYQACQRIFHKGDSLCLTRELTIRRSIRNKALRRFLHGCPPRKKGDTSLGDALNWEWMVHCAHKQNADLVVLTRDSDYGMVFQDKAYPNDHLVHEFTDRVTRQKKLILATKISEALKHFQVAVTEKERREEDALATPAATSTNTPRPSDDFITHLVEVFQGRIVNVPSSSLTDVSSGDTVHRGAPPLPKT
jgi:hypothetical protein